MISDNDSFYGGLRPMRELLEQDIIRQFGPVYGLKKKKELRQEIVTNALDRYDEELSNGASEEDAYRTTMASIGDLHALRKPLSSRSQDNVPVSALLALIAGILCIALEGMLFLPYSEFSPFSGLLFVVFLCCFFGAPILALSAVILGIVGIVKSNHWKCMSRKGVVLSMIGICLAVFHFVIRILGIVLR